MPNVAANWRTRFLPRAACASAGQSARQREVDRPIAFGEGAGSVKAAHIGGVQRPANRLAVVAQLRFAADADHRLATVVRRSSQLRAIWISLRPGLGGDRGQRIDQALP